MQVDHFHCGHPRFDSPGLQATHSPCFFSAASQAVELVNQWQEFGAARQHLSFVPPSQPDRTCGSPPSLMSAWLIQMDAKAICRMRNCSA